MSKPFYEGQEKLWWELAEKWKGTPFKAGQCSMGHGVDCLRLVHSLHKEAGGIKGSMYLPSVPMDATVHQPRVILLPKLLGNIKGLEGRFLPVPVHGPLMCGDLIGIKYGWADFHTMTYLSHSKAVHVWKGVGVIIDELTEERYQKRILYTLRLYNV